MRKYFITKLVNNYLNSNYNDDVLKFLKLGLNKKIITDGAYIDLNPGTVELEILQIVKKKVYQSIDTFIVIDKKVMNI